MKKRYRNCPCTPCGLIISGEAPMCSKHWELVPAHERDAIFEAQRKGQYRACREAIANAVKFVNAWIAGPTT